MIIWNENGALMEVHNDNDMIIFWNENEEYKNKSYENWKVVCFNLKKIGSYSINFND